MEKFAHLAIYLKDRKRNICYTVANSHITRQISDTIYLKENLKKVHIGRVNSRTTSDIIEHLDIVEIHEPWSHKLSNWFVNHNGVAYRVSCYNSTRAGLFGKEVFKVRPWNSWKQFDTVDRSRIATADDHIRVLSNKECEFLVDHKNGSFSSPGESGTPVAIWGGTNYDQVKIVGVLSGETDEQTFTVCLFLPVALADLKRNHDDKDLEIVVNTCPKNDDIVCGTLIMFMTPEKVAPFNFDLKSKVIELTCFKLSSFDTRQYSTLLEKETKIREYVNKRVKHDDFDHNCDDPIFTAFYSRLQACDCLYQGNTEQAEFHLKTTVRCILRSHEHALNLRIISKLFTVVTWYCIDMKLEGAEDLFTRALEFCQENHDMEGFPGEVISYIYYDFGRYYDMLYTKRKDENVSRSKLRDIRLKGLAHGEQAVKTLKKLIGVENAADVKADEISSTNREWLVLMVSDYVRGLMGCGAEFDCKDIGLVTKRETEKADCLLKEIKGLVPHVPLVQQMSYQEALCDLHYLKEEYDKALNIAQECLAMANGTELYDKARLRAAKRVESISKEIE